MNLADAYHAFYMAVLVCLSVLTLFCLFRAIQGPRIADRIVSINMICTLTMTMICILAAMLGEGYLVDVALIYALLGFLAVVVLFYVVEHWNSWFSASIYLRDRDRFPLQLFLREILISSSASTASQSTPILPSSEPMSPPSWSTRAYSRCSLVRYWLPFSCAMACAVFMVSMVFFVYFSAFISKPPHS